MKTLKNIKNYSLGFVVGVACISSIAYGASNGSIGNSFSDVSGVWKLIGTNITNDSITAGQLADNSVENSELATSAVTQSKVSGGYVDTTNNQTGINGNKTFVGIVTFSNTINGSITGNAGTVSNGVYTNNAQTITGQKTFSSQIIGDISGNAGSVTDGVYLSTTQTITGTKTFSNTINGSITGNAGTVSNGVYTNNAQTITGQKTFSSQILANAGVQSTSFIYTSDRRFKENIETIQTPLQTVQALRGVTWNWKKDGKADIGFIAQEVEEVLPELVYTDKNGYKGVQYGNMVGLLVEAVKEQQKQIDELNAKLNALQK